MGPFLDALFSTLGVWIPRILGALLILLVGWLVARVVASIARRLLGLTKLDNRLAKLLEGSSTRPPKVEDIVAKVVYYVILFIAILGALNALGLTQVSALFSDMFNKVFVYLPRLVYAGILALVAWLIASVLKAVVVRLLQGLGADKRVSDRAGTETSLPVSSSVGEAVYWLVWLLFLPAILQVLGFAGLLAPVQAMLNGLLGFLPNLLAAAIILIVGLFVARILQRIVAAALGALGADLLSERVGLAPYLGKPNLSGLLGYIVYVLVFVPVLIAALNALGLAFVATPIVSMLNAVLLAIPNIFAAIVIVVVAYVIGRVIADLVANLLSGAGFDNLMARLGLGEAPTEGKTTPSRIVGYLILVAIMLFAVMAAAGMLHWTALVTMLEAFIAFIGQVLLALLVLAIGIYLANLAAKVILSTNLEQKRLLALLARVAIVVFATVMALDQTGIGKDIVNLAFGLILAGIALAAGLAFGLGGRDVAKYQLVRWYKSVEAELEEKKEK